MPFELAPRLFSRAQQYLRTADNALEVSDVDAAFENARTAAELFAKSMLAHRDVPYGTDHNVAGVLVREGLWPRSRGAELGKLLGEYVRGVYSFTSTVAPRDVKRALRLARDLEEAARATIAGGKNS